MDRCCRIDRSKQADIAEHKVQDESQADESDASHGGSIEGFLSYKKQKTAGRRDGPAVRSTDLLRDFDWAREAPCVLDEDLVADHVFVCVDLEHFRCIP